MKKYFEPAMTVIALRNDAALLAGSTPGLGGSLGSGDEILAPGMDGDLPPGMGDDILDNVLPSGPARTLLFGM